MLRTTPLLGIMLLVFAFVVPREAGALGIADVAQCQRKFASAGAQFASRLVNFTLKCTTKVSQCQIECEEGLFGPSCDANPPPCCDVDDPLSNGGYEQCLDEAQIICDKMAAKIVDAETIKQIKIVSACKSLTLQELCGAETPGLNFAILSAGCQALDPGFTCNLLNLLNCVGGPLERQLTDQIASLLDPRAGESLAALGLEERFPGIPRGRKARGEIGAGTVDVWAISGIAGEEFTVQLSNRNDNGVGTTGLAPSLSLLDRDGQGPVPDTEIGAEVCPIATACGNGTCPIFSRRLPFTGTFYLQIGTGAGPGCTGGKYKLVVRSPRGSRPTLVADDVAPGAFVP